MHIRRIQYLLIGAGSFFILGNGIRFYRLIRTHTEDHFFAPHLLLVMISLTLGWKVLQRGRQKNDLTRKDAISLIRTGSVLMGIWTYRFYLVLSHTSGRMENLLLSVVFSGGYILLGGMTMGVGLYVSRSLRNRTEHGI